MAMRLVVLVALTALVTSNDVVQTFMEQREVLIEKERAMRFDVSQVLSPNEELLNDLIVSWRDEEIDRLYPDFIGSYSFYKIKEELDNSPLLQLFREMPKGGTLHSHLDALTPFDWLIKTATYDPNVYIYLGKKEYWGKKDGVVKVSSDNKTSSPAEPLFGTFRFMTSDKVAELNAEYSSGLGPWYNVVEIRALKPDPEAFDAWLLSLITLGQEDVDAGDVWIPFQNCFIRAGGLTFYDLVFEKFVRKAFESAKADNLQFLEFRTLPIRLYALDGSESSNPVESYKLIRDISQDFLDDSFFGIHIIESVLRIISKEEMKANLGDTLVHHLQFPEMIVGFDIVGQEDRGETLLFYLDEFLEFQEAVKEANTTFPFYFHGGESLFIDTERDENLYDALLLDSKRIGHGYAFRHHPLLLDMVKAKKVAIEICPISNQILELVDDFRNHPIASYITMGVPFVLSYDDPFLFGYDSLAYDLVIGIYSWGLDLRGVKQILENSITYSAFGDDKKAALLARFEEMFATFVSRKVSEFQLLSTEPPSS